LGIILTGQVAVAIGIFGDQHFAQIMPLFDDGVGVFRAGLEPSALTPLVMIIVVHIDFSLL
jgi:hypothetical protein